MGADLKVSLLVDDKGTVKIKKFSGQAKKELVKLGGLVTSKLGKAFKNTAKVAAKTFSGITKQLLSIKGLLLGIGIGMMGKAFLDAANTSEQYRVRLNALLGSVEEGNKLFGAMNDYASRTPFEFEEIMGAAVQLAGVMKGGVKEVVEWMPMIGDLAAVSGLSMQQTTEQVVRMYSAGAGAADLFRERGITAMLGFQAGVSYSAEETRKKLMESWTATDSKFKDVTDNLAGTWKGLMSMFSDKWFAFRNAVMESKVFDRLKSTASAILKLFDQWKDEGKIQKWAETTGEAAIKTFKIIIEWSEKAVKAGLWLYSTFLKVRLGFDKFVADYARSALDRMTKITDVTKKTGEMSAAPFTRYVLGKISGNWNEKLQHLRDLAASSKGVMEQHARELTNTEKTIAVLGRKYAAVKKEMAEKVDVGVNVTQAISNIERIGDTWNITASGAADGLIEQYRQAKGVIESDPIRPRVIVNYDFNISGGGAGGEEQARALKEQLDRFEDRGIE